jgi:hypothetical protein
MTPREGYRRLAGAARWAGLALIVLSVVFARRGLLGWPEVAYLTLCISMQEVFLRMPSLWRWRTLLLVFYSLLPLGLIALYGAELRALSGDLVQLALYTPLPLALVSVQIMVLYVREAARLTGVVLVLVLFLCVIGVRRPLDDVVWPWLAAMAALGALYLALHHPLGLAFTKRAVRPSARPWLAWSAGLPLRSLLLGLAVIAATTALFFGLPRPAWGAGKPEPVATPLRPGTPGTEIAPTGPPPAPPTRPAVHAGLAGGVALGDYGEIKLSSEHALRVAVGGDDAPDVLYLRALTFAGFDGERWQALPAEAEFVHELEDAAVRPLPGAPLPMRWAATGLFSMEFAPGGIARDGHVPLPVEAAHVREFAGPLWYDQRSNTLRAPTLTPGDVLTVSARRWSASPEQFANALAGRGPDRDAVPLDYLRVPTELREALQMRFRFFSALRAQAQAENTGSPPAQRGAYAAAAQIVRMFHTFRTSEGEPAWEYSLTRRPETGPYALARFLDADSAEAQRYGHCEYYASAMCVLLRCFGVPCRLATGFAARLGDDGEYHVKQSDAHAWVEVWFSDFGWLSFDPTPPAHLEVSAHEPSPPQTDATEADAPEDDATGEEQGPAGKDWVDGYDREAQQRLFSTIGSWVSYGASLVSDGLMGWLPSSWLPESPLVRILLLMAPVTALLLWLGLRRRGRRTLTRAALQSMGGGGKEQERGLYLQLLVLLAKHGYIKRRSETPLEFARRVCSRGGDSWAPVLAMTERYYALRFGQQREAEREFRDALDQLKASQEEN